VIVGYDPIVLERRTVAQIIVSILLANVVARIIVVRIFGADPNHVMTASMLVGAVIGACAGKWATGAAARRAGRSYKPDPVERMWMRLQLRRQLRQLKP
jgi:hypothetical protein